MMVSNMREKSGQVSMPCIAEGLGMSERQLERLSHQQLGFTPKTFARIARLQAVLRHLIANPETKLVDVASNFGYSDQTHMTRDFTRFGRITPVMYRRSLQHVGFVLDAELPTR